MGQLVEELVRDREEVARHRRVLRQRCVLRDELVDERDEARRPGVDDEVVPAEGQLERREETCGGHDGNDGPPVNTPHKALEP